MRMNKTADQTCCFAKLFALLCVVKFLVPLCYVQQVTSYVTEEFMKARKFSQCAMSKIVWALFWDVVFADNVVIESEFYRSWFFLCRYTVLVCAKID